MFAIFCFENKEFHKTLLETWFIENVGDCRRPSDKLQYAREIMLKCRPKDNNCPLILSNLTFNHFSNFLSQRTSRQGKNKGKSMSLGTASYNQAKSTLLHLFQMSTYDMHMEFAKKLKLFMKGMKRHVTAKNMEDGDSGIIGKRRWGSKCTRRFVSFS